MMLSRRERIMRSHEQAERTTRVLAKRSAPEKADDGGPPQR
jgi:hypothetical protein